MNDFATFDMLPFIPPHFLCTHFWHLVHCNELLPTPLLQTPHGHLAAFCHTIWRSALIITLFLFMPLLSTFSFHSFSLLISSSSVSAITAKSSAWQGNPKFSRYGLHDNQWPLVHTHFYLKTFAITIDCSDDRFCTCLHRHHCWYKPLFNSQLTHCPAYHYQKLSPNPQNQNRAFYL